MMRSLLPDARSEAGTSLIEVLVALSIFMIIMGVVTAFAISGMRTIRDAMAISDAQVEQQNALLWSTRLIAYADNPSEGIAPVPWIVQGKASATPGTSQMTFYTYSGTGPKDGVPYRVRLGMDAKGNITSTIATPQQVPNYSGWCWEKADNASCASITPDINGRVLVAASADHSPGLSLTFRDKAGSDLAVPAANATAATWAAWASSVAAVKIRIFDAKIPTQSVEQVMALENPR